jgi:hypothetical protein
VRALLAVAACLLFANAARGESFTVRIQETAIIEIPGATAAYTTNPAVADATVVAAGRLSVTGHSAGTTQVVVVTAGSTQAYLVTVAAPSLPSVVRAEAGAPLGRYEGRYASGSMQVQNTFDLATQHGARRSEIHVLHVHDLRAGPGQPSDTIASIFYRDTTPTRQVTLLDEAVNLSRMTISNTSIRGLHLKAGPLELHAGYASSAMFDDFFLPAGRRWVGGGGYGIDVASVRLTPSVYGFFSQPTGTAARRGVVGALSAEYRDGDTVFVRGDVGVSRSLAASGEVRYAGPRDQIRALVSIKPADFPNLGLADVPGNHVELDWTRRATNRLSITSYGTYDRFDLAALRQTIGVANLGISYAATPRLTLLSGAEASTVRTSTRSIRTIGLPLGVAYDMPAFGLAASYRLLDHSEASRRGDTLRLSAHGGSGLFTANVWAERQRNAPTLDLIFSAEPGLELALLRLGISVRTPEEVARALRDNAALIDLGFITGVNVSLAPRRLQAGFNVAWLGSGSRRDRLRLLAVYGHDEGISSTRDNVIGTLTYSRRILATTDVYGSYSRWSTRVGMVQAAGTSVEVGVQQQFSGLPRFLQRSGTIEGFAFLDPEMGGVRNQTTKPLPDIVVTLDGQRTSRTDGKGAYVFDKVSPGPHRIAAQLPASPRGFFTTPSHVETKVQAHIDFGLVWAAARIEGRVINDAGGGIPGAVLTATAENGHPISVTSDAEGLFVFAVPPGTFRVGLTEGSLSAGYSLAEPRERNVTVEADQPKSVTFGLNVRRSIAGRARGASEVRIETQGMTARVDPEGNFLFRSMPAGTFTLVALIGGRTVTRTVTLSVEPVMERDVDLGGLSSGVAKKASPVAPIGHTGAFRVQAGAFRSPGNAAAARRLIERLGGHVEITRSGAFDLVMVGPFESREAAEAEVTRFGDAGIDAVVVGGRAPSPAAPPASRHP